MAEITEKWLELGKCYVKHAMKLNELNLTTVNDFMRHTGLEKLGEQKTGKVEDIKDIFKMQQQMLKDMNGLSSKYVKDFFALFTESSSDIFKQFADLGAEFSHMTESAARNVTNITKPATSSVRENLK